MPFCIPGRTYCFYSLHALCEIGNNFVFPNCEYYIFGPKHYPVYSIAYHIKVDYLTFFGHRVCPSKEKINA